MSIFEGFLYGVIQALTEFLPVSSSGHLALLPHFLSFNDPGVAFDLAMHIGTALAVIIYFYRDIIWLLKSKHIVNYIVATLATLSLIFLVKDFASVQGRQSWLIATNLVIFGWVLYLSDRVSVSKADDFKKSFYIKESIIIGLSQVLAVFPGVSRSGITISAGRLMGFNKTQASAFSFLLSIPIILGGALLKAKEVVELDHKLELLPMVIGVGVSFFLGLIVIHYFFKLIKKINFIYFAFYRTILACIIFYFIY